MPKRIGMEVAVAVAEAVGQCNIDMAAVYPITPQSHIAEHLSEMVADGKVDAEFVTVESEHSAMSAVIGASSTGARVYTATSSQGLMLMHELLPIASAMRLPIVMGIANRAVSGPLNILNDHSDIMPQRDSGWIYLFVENGQEAIDLSIQAFKIAEHKDVLLPVCINIDGNTSLCTWWSRSNFPSRNWWINFCRRVSPMRPFIPANLSLWALSPCRITSRK